MKIANSITDLIGHTPIVELHNLKQKAGFKGRILAKIESFNPGGSVKDRVAVAMIEAAGLKKGAVIIEPTSGNTGVGLAMVAAARSMSLMLTMPESMSIERRQLLSALGAKLVLTPASKGMQGAVDRAQELKSEIEGSVILSQFDNPANPMTHQKTTAHEIFEDTGGLFDAFVAGIGTGGTVSGVGKTIKKHNPEIQVIGVEPAESPLLTTGKAGPHKIQGIGANFIPENFDCSVVDFIMPITAQDAIESARLLALTEGILAGVSSGAALRASIEQATEGRTIVVLLPDTGERYLSTNLFE